ncbi:MAG: hypothetical protein HYW25_01520 [Candidatus Aenigmarchaeota archaeon]|nr:hypothetical protein [Candidatus Aenigmarchaeota archaeon]
MKGRFPDKARIISLFRKVRDIPYRIPVKYGEEDFCCSGKSKLLHKLLTKEGCKVRYRVCVFRWSDLNIPQELEGIKHDKECTHTFLEIMIEGKWRVLDATWDSRLKNLFHVNEWNDKSAMKIAVKPIKTFSPEKSVDVIKKYSGREAMERDLKANGKFYKAFNEWLEENRR